MLIVTPWRFRVPVKSSPVNWLPWSVLKISGFPYREIASSSASTQNSAPSVFDNRHASTARLTQSMIHRQVEEALGHRDVRAPDLIDPLDRNPTEQVGVDLVGHRRLARVILGRGKIPINPASRIRRRTRLRLTTWPWVASHAAI